MKEIKLSQKGKYKDLNLVALVDDIDYEYLNQWKWCVINNENSKCFYAARTVSRNGKRNLVKMQHFVLGTTNAKIIIDHKDLNGLNNTRANLRIANNSENGANRKSFIGSTSKYLGVSWSKQKNKWVAYITKHGRTKNLGCSESEEDVARLYDNAALRLHGQFANTNFK